MLDLKVCAIRNPRYGFAVRVLSHIYNPPKSPFDKGGLVARLCLALLRNMSVFIARAIRPALQDIRATAS